MSLRQRVLGNSAWQISEKTIRAVVGLFVGIWVARYLGSSQFGLLNFCIAYVALFAFMAELGLQTIVVREIVRRPSERSTIVASALVLKFAGAIVAIALSAGTVHFLRSDVSAMQVVAVLGLALLPQAWDVIDYSYQAEMHGRPIALIRTVSLLAFAAARVFLILDDARLIWFAWVVVGEAALSAVLMFVLYRVRNPVRGSLQISLSEMKRLMTDAWPMAIASLSVVLYMRIDQVMLGYMLDDHSVGVFSAAVRVSEAWYFIPMAFLASVAPALTAAYTASHSDYEHKLRMFIRAMLGLGIAAAFGLVLFSDLIISLLYGPEYRESATVLRLHGWAGVFVSLGLAAGPWFVNANLLKIRMIHTLLGAACNVGLNLLLIPRWGVTGAALSTVVSYSIAAVWLNALSCRTRPLFWLQATSLLYRRPKPSLGLR